MNGSTNSNVYVSSNGQPIPDNFIFETVDPSQDDSEDSDSATYNEAHGGIQQTSGLKPGKKTKGRVKIKMEFIENKLRRYTTFSKRKTGIMKKAYELSTLTGTQVMLLVASETGHVYTFATRKLQPMITSESGKALIQTCLNSPDSASGASATNSLEQRMNPSGFEETELSCVVPEEEQKVFDVSNSKPVFPSGAHVVTIAPPQHQEHRQQQDQRHQQQALNLAEQVNKLAKVQREATSIASSKAVSHAQFEPAPSIALPQTQVINKEPGVSSNGDNGINSTNTSISTMQIPVILSQGGAIPLLQTPGVSVGQAISIPQISQPSSSSSTSLSSSSSSTSSVFKPSALSQVVTALSNQAAAHSQTNNSGDLNTPLPVSTPSINIMQNMTPGIVMYHTPQGVVYATPTQNLHDRTIFNFSQPPAAISMTQSDQVGAGQQFITIPVPMSGTPLMQLANPPTPGNNSADDTGQGKQPPAKKLKK